MNFMPKKKKNSYWPLQVFFATLVVTMILSLLSETTLLGIPIFAAVLALVFIVFVGIMFDMIGVAVTFEDTTAYNAMSSRKIRGAKQALRLIKNASKVSNICNDIVGDICGIVSGAMGVAIVTRIASTTRTVDDMILTVLVSGITAAMTVGGKAYGKEIAMSNSQKIVLATGRLLSIFSKNENKRKRA